MSPASPSILYAVKATGRKSLQTSFVIFATNGVSSIFPMMNLRELVSFIHRSNQHAHGSTSAMYISGDDRRLYDVEEEELSLIVGMLRESNRKVYPYISSDIVSRKWIQKLGSSS
eukprot:GEZU01038506.1.p2 GENE.GEZU01038506.1~~GEZU01038506.1.p2  ORF type:complete len:115 (-),score=10.32 GEZU01038506.1:276-620(-)